MQHASKHQTTPIGRSESNLARFRAPLEASNTDQNETARQVSFAPAGARSEARNGTKRDGGSAVASDDKNPVKDPGLVICDITNAPGSELWSTRMPSRAEVDQAASKITPAPHGTHGLTIAPGVIRVGRIAPDQHQSKKNDQKRIEQDSTVTKPHRGLITEWTARSRFTMVRTFASLDYSPMIAQDRIPAMITLTLPGDWLTVAPNAEAYKRLIQRFQQRWQAKWKEPLCGLWKQEFQRRGAPHTHIYTSLPHESGFRQWLSATWSDIVDHPDAKQRTAHERAGTQVKTDKALRATDPKKIANYFAKHGLFSAKEYQNQKPDEWESTGRLWGYWRLEKATAQVPVTDQEAVEIQRLLRRMEHSTYTRITKKVWRTVRPEIIDEETGEILQEAKRRKRTTHVRLGQGRHVGARGGGTMLVDDGIATAADIGRYLEYLRQHSPYRQVTP